jgi:hypothetical protein
MTTEYTLHQDGLSVLELIHQSDKFYLSSESIVLGELARTDTLSSKQVVQIALRLLQAVLYNVKDSKKYFEEVISVEVNKLYR